VTYRPQDIAEARDWVKDCVGDPDNVDHADDDRVVRAVNRMYPDGMDAFVAECGGAS
jgi:hypothetical protein